eukprot:scaffold2201_cov110-Isochrysis_galbana.AAC.11
MEPDTYIHSPAARSNTPQSKSPAARLSLSRRVAGSAGSAPQHFLAPVLDSANDAAITAMQRPRYTLRGRDIMYNAQRSHPLSPQPQPQRFSFSSWGGGRVGGLWIAVGWMGVKAANRNLKIYKKKYIMNDDEYVAENFSA